MTPYSSGLIGTLCSIPAILAADGGQQRELDGGERRYLQGKIEQGVQEEGMNPQRPGGAKGGRQTRQGGRRHEREQGRAAFGGPLGPVVVSMVDREADIEGGEFRVNGGIGSESVSGPGPLADHLDGGRQDLPAIAERIGILKLLPKLVPTDYAGGEDADCRGGGDKSEG